MNKVLKQGSIVTLKFENVVSSNTYLVESDCGDTVLLQHPLFPECLIRSPKDSLDVVAPNIKDSIERSLDFAKKNSGFLDYNTTADLEALSLYFVVRRKLTPRQKNLLATMCGTIACIKLNNDIRAAMTLITNNSAILDEFNTLWFRNFSGLFSGKQPITSKKQRASIFNMAGFVMAELASPRTENDGSLT